MAVALTNRSGVFVSLGGSQNVYFQQTSSLLPPITWSNLNGGPLGDASIRNYTISNATSDPFPKFFRLIAWYPE